MSQKRYIPPKASTGNEVHMFLGESNQNCACCRKPFTTKLPSPCAIRIPMHPVLPVFAEYRLCAACGITLGSEGDSADAAFVSVMAFHNGEEATQ
jgi:hypothetical protein